MLGDIKRLIETDKSDITLKRISGALFRRIKAVPHRLAWSGFSTYARENKKRLREFKNIHKGERCFIIGNGPSLNKTDLSFLKNEFTFGMNRIYLMFDKVGFETTYFAAVNHLVLDQFGKEISKYKMPKFIPWSRRNDFGKESNYIYLNESFNEIFAEDIDKPFGNGGTVTYTCIQLAFHMGFSEVYLIGIDHNFVDKGISGKEIISKSADKNHFDPNYFGKGVKWGLPNLFLSERAYLLSRKTYESNKVIIKDATIEGKLQIFDKVNYNDLFK